jgi:three-Cys-motif partner protein
MDVCYDEIGNWTKIKLDIVKEYASAYSRIMAAQRNPSLCHIYIDAFAGAGLNIARSTGDFVLGSPLNALSVSPPFKEFHLIDMDQSKIDSLKQLTNTNPRVKIYEGDCNQILLQEVFPKARFENYRRALCLLDPYGLHLNWDVIAEAGQMKSVEIFLNFPVADMNRNVLWRNPEGVDPTQIERMTAFWGDGSWREIVYDNSRNLFGWDQKNPNSNEVIAKAFQERLGKVGKFAYVPDPIPMRNSNNAIVYYLFFASQKPVAKRIVEDIFNKYRRNRDN